MFLLASICAFLAAPCVHPAFAETSAETDPVTGMEFVPVKGGCSPMGDSFGAGDSDERPVHEVCVSDFRIGRHIVTREQRVKVVGNNPSRFKKGGHYPVENVSWDDVQRFIKRLNGKPGRKYRPPTEAEFEYAARSGGRNEKCAGTSGDAELDDYAWHYRKYYHHSPRKDPKGPAFGFYRGLGGGCWDTDARDSRAASRYRSPQEIGNGKRGFRLVLPVRAPK